LFLASCWLLPLNLYAVQLLQGESCEQNLACDMRKTDLSRSARVTATSTLENSRKYAPSNLLDRSPDAAPADFWGEPKTAWCEGVRGTGIGEAIRIDFSSPQPVAVISISPGYEKSLDLFAKNSRIMRALLSLSDGSQYQLVFRKHFYELSDGKQSWQRMNSRYQEINSPQMFVLSPDGQQPKVVRWLELSIVETVTGSKYQDTCISRIDITPRWDMNF
jgi:hypothetical protein